MNIYIGQNIKRLRLAKGVTQESLADYLSISAPAVSKWERGDTLPDITMLPVLAMYFDVTIDELMGFDAAKVERSIELQYAQYTALSAYPHKRDEAERLITELHRQYPANHKLAIDYMYQLIDGKADNCAEVVLGHAAEFTPLCERILNESTITACRLDAANILAKICIARGEEDKALAYLRDFPDWFHTREQKIEQLYSKDTDKFRRQVTANMRLLLDFAFNKVGKAIWYSGKSVQDRDEQTRHVVGALKEYIAASGCTEAYFLISSIYHEGGKVLNIEKQYDKAVEYYGQMLLCLSEPENGAQQVKASVGWLKSTPFLADMRKRDDFRAMLGKYGAGIKA